MAGGRDLKGDSKDTSSERLRRTGNTGVKWRDRWVSGCLGLWNSVGSTDSRCLGAVGAQEEGGGGGRRGGADDAFVLQYMAYIIFSVT